MLYYRDTANEAYRFWAIVCFAVAAISDGIDGYIARKYNQRSVLGKVLDPLADKLLLVSGLVILCLPKVPQLIQIPLWLAVIVFGRDIILGLGIILIYVFCGKIKGNPHIIGKTSTVLQIAVVSWALLKWNEEWLFWIMLATGITTGISGLIYIGEGIKNLSETPESLPTAPETEPKKS
jgi:cardiolipin synthase